MERSITPSESVMAALSLVRLNTATCSIGARSDELITTICCPLKKAEKTNALITKRVRIVINIKKKLKYHKKCTNLKCW